MFALGTSQLNAGVSATRMTWVVVGAISWLREEAGTGASMAVKEEAMWAAGLAWVARVHGATLDVGRYTRSVREASGSHAPRAAGQLGRWACAC